MKYIMVGRITSGVFTYPAIQVMLAPAQFLIQFLKTWHRMFEQNRRKIRRRAIKATERCMKRMTKSRGNPPPSVYNLLDKVLVRVSTGPRFSKRYAVIPGKVFKRNADLSKYKVKF